MKGSVMIVALLLCVLVLALMGAWLGRRRHAVLAWDRELDTAFSTGDRREVPSHRVL